MSIRTMAAQPLEATPRSNSYVTIQMRRGLESQMDKSKFLPAEFGATTDTKKLFFAFGAGDVQQLATYQNLEGLMAQALASLEEEYLGSITQATQNAINATSQASSAATAANQAADEANEIIDAFKKAVDGTVISDSSTSSSTAYSSQKIENDFLKKTGNGSNVTVTFQQAAERAGIQSGDSLAVAFGKLAKFCADIQDYVFSAPVASLASTDAARPLAASMGKQIGDDMAPIKAVTRGVVIFANSVSLASFLNEIFEVANTAPQIGAYAAIPFRVKATVEWSPMAQENWIKGMVFIQNANYDYSEIGGILAINANTFYYGRLTNEDSTPKVKWFDVGSSSEHELTAITSGDSEYFNVDGGHAIHSGQMYTLHIDVRVLKQVAENLDTGGGVGARILNGLPFSWRYNFYFPATISGNTAILLRGIQGENSVRLHAYNPPLPVGTKIIANFSVPVNYVS